MHKKLFDTNDIDTNEKLLTALQRRHIALTKAELKVSNLIYQNFSNKEIATMLNLSVRGVESHRLNIRKKLGVKGNLNLTDYLKKLK